jgi:ribonuclease P protein component
LFIVSTAAGVPQASNDLPSARLGLIIAKRFAANAVTRNAIKRVVREAFRQTRTVLPPVDYVVRLNAPVPPLSLTALKHKVRIEVDAHFARVLRQ